MPVPFDPPGSERTYEEQLEGMRRILKFQEDGIERRLEMMRVLEDTLKNYRSKTEETVKDEPA